MSVHSACKRSTSASSASSDAPSAAVRTITPASSGITRLRMDFNRLRSLSGSLRLIPVIDPCGTYTRNRPGREIWLVSRAPFCPTGSLVICTKTGSPDFRANSMRLG